MLTAQTLRIGGRYNWRNRPERLIYTGMCEPRNGRWHQFEKVGEPGAVWCEVLGADLHMLEETPLCGLCDQGFPKEDGIHHGSQSLGMIPPTACAAHGLPGTEGGSHV